MSWKLSCTVWRRGKGRDYFKALPILFLKYGIINHKVKWLQYKKNIDNSGINRVYIVINKIKY